MSTGNFTIGVDLGGTNLRIGAYTSSNGLLEAIQLRTRLCDGPHAVASDMCAAIQTLRRRYQERFSLRGIGVGSPGPLELPAGVLRQSPNLPGWDGFNLRAEVERVMGTSVLLQNDANVAALAEFKLGRGRSRGVDSLCMLTLGTGVGGGIILHGKIWDGITGMAGEVGHLNIWTEGGMPCGCGSSGCLEAHASATGVRKMAEDEIAHGTAPGLAGLYAAKRDFDARDVAELANAGDANAGAIFQKVGHSLGIGLASLVNVLNLPLYVLGGGLANAWELFEGPLFEELRRRSYIYRLTADKAHVVTAELGPDAGLLGACLLPLQTE
ncbi:MAG TPA: ROK family protein [Candidatus Acidoferrales bacterium]|jgi:glucokinase|nr:ROK family protein [Candidatus Acidoferrales bacterium]